MGGCAKHLGEFNNAGAQMLDIVYHWAFVLKCQDFAI